MNQSQAIPLPSATTVSQDNQIKILVAVYEKHARELLALEESQEKMILLVLGVFSVMIAFLVKDQQAKDFLTGHCERKILLCLFSLVLALERVLKVGLLSAHPPNSLLLCSYTFISSRFSRCRCPLPPQLTPHNTNSWSDASPPSCVVSGSWTLGS